MFIKDMNDFLRNLSQIRPTMYTTKYNLSAFMSLFLMSNYIVDTGGKEEGKVIPFNMVLSILRNKPLQRSDAFLGLPICIGHLLFVETEGDAGYEMVFTFPHLVAYNNDIGKDVFIHQSTSVLLAKEQLPLFEAVSLVVNNFAKQGRDFEDIEKHITEFIPVDIACKYFPNLNVSTPTAYTMIAAMHDYLVKIGAISIDGTKPSNTRIDAVSFMTTIQDAWKDILIAHNIEAEEKGTLSSQEYETHFLLKYFVGMSNDYESRYLFYNNAYDDTDLTNLIKHVCEDMTAEEITDPEKDAFKFPQVMQLYGMSFGKELNKVAGKGLLKHDTKSTIFRQAFAHAKTNSNLSIPEKMTDYIFVKLRQVYNKHKK